MHRHPLRQALRLPQAALKRLVTGLLQLVLLANRPARLARSGFVLPTTVLLVLMVVLTVTALTYRSFTRSDMAISQREQQVISNAATPALDRARAKIEFIFNKDTRYTSGLPTSDFLASMMLDTPYLPAEVTTLAGDPFTLPGETRLDINNDGILDNAWSFRGAVKSGASGAATEETIVYSILVDDQATPADRVATTGANLQTVSSPVTQNKANALITRTGPLATTEATTTCSNARAEAGWQVVSNGSSSALQKNFQINVFVPNANNANRTVEAFEFQQSRIASRGNKWAAWFRYDMEIFPGSPFSINGAMHTDGNLMATGGFQNGSLLTSYKVSSQNSCVYSKLASEVTVGAKSTDGTYEGQIVFGTTAKNSYSGNNDAFFHIWNGDKVIPITNQKLTDANDSVTGGAPADIAVNPLVLFTQDKLQHTTAPGAGSWSRDNASWNNNPIFTGGRVLNKKVAKPFVDDFSRADNRWGPKPRYSDTDATLALSSTRTTGSTIPTSTTALTDPIKGLDGYWERQATNYGLRLIVGERLELGNPREWNFNPSLATPGVDTTNFDRLYPPNAAPTVSGKIGANEYRQKLTLRDNLAAVQGMVVYHQQINSGAFPAACMAMTAHPGTQQTIIDSRTFDTYPSLSASAPKDRRVDFLNGKGTNGWEFQFPNDATTGFDTPTKFAAQIADGQPLGIALRNLARFAGDPSGGAPYFQPVQDSNVHPAPFLSMWGDFSPLRRILVAYDAASGTAAAKYTALSLADKATLHSAACTISMLAYNVDRELADLSQVISTNSTQLQNVSQQLGKSVQTVMDCLAATAGNKASACKSGNFDVLPFLKTRGDINNLNITTWTDPNLATVITAGSLCPAGSDSVGFQSNCDSGEYFDSWRLADWTAFINLPNVSNSLKDDERAQLITDLTAFSQRINTLYTSVRDRDLGFRKGTSTKAGVVYSTSAGSYVAWTNGVTAPVTIGGGNNDRIYSVGCDPNIFQTLSAKGGGGAGNNVMLGLLACSELKVQPVKYPALYYLFPTNNHDHDGTGYHQQPDGVTLPTATQAAEPYITDTYVKTVNPTTGDPSTYRVVGTDSVFGLSAIAAVPRSIDPTTWTVPASASTVTALNNPDATDQAFVIATPTSRINVPFLDKGMLDGREQMSARVLDIDLARLTTTRVAGGTTDFWISDIACDATTQDCSVFTEGIVYAAREDAVREDEIVRPKKASQNAADCLTVATITSANCRMIVTGTNSPQDPPLTDALVSLKPVDFYADPARRPYGFRLRNGIDMSRGKARKVGMTFITDNSAYILGNFNLHSTGGTVATIIEEFNSTINGVDWTNANFYTNRTATGTTPNGLNTNFSKPATDTWRPVEILSDALTILANGFVDGEIEDTFITDRPTTPAATSSSYLNQSRPNTAQTTVVRANGANTPVWLDRNGNAYVGTTAISGASGIVWTGLGDSEENDRRLNGRRIPNTENAFVNGVFISGIVPSRINQSYGGLQNFPRLTELWSWGSAAADRRDLQIAGGFLQLNFSTASTAPFEHDAWEPGDSPGNPEQLGYYRPPARRWGYDPGLLYYPPAAAARRFISIDTPRSEYFRELPADDPYIANLRCARAIPTPGNAAPVYDASIRGTCPPA